MPATVTKEAPRVFVHAGLPAAGKSTAAKVLADRLGAKLVSKDNVNPLESRQAQRLAHGPDDRDSVEFFAYVYPVTMAKLGEAVTRYVEAGSSVVVDAPLLREARACTTAEERLADVLAGQWGLSDDVVVTVIWHQIDSELQRSRMAKRGAARDETKLADWDGYQSALDDQLGELRSIYGLRYVADRIVLA